MTKIKPEDPALAAKLTPLQYQVTQCSATEPAFRNAFWDHHEPGIYVDIVSGEPLFASTDKFDSGTGWPSFTKPLVPAQVTELVDSAYGMKRVEVRSANGDSHLGHVFDDGPGDAGLRYCINSAALRFVSASRLVAEGYPQFAANFPRITQESANSEPRAHEAAANQANPRNPPNPPRPRESK